MSPQNLKTLFADYHMVTATFEADSVKKATKALFLDDALIKLCHPFGTVNGGADLFDAALAPLHAAMLDLERRDMILLAGRTPEGQD